jgi:hypothetical protein
LFLAPSGRATLGHLQELFQLSPVGEMKLDSAIQALLNSGKWTTTELYADVLEGHLLHFDNTIKGMTKPGEGWASQPVSPKIKNATLDILAFLIKTITSALSARGSLLPRKRNQDDKGHESPSGVGSLKASKGIPTQSHPHPGGDAHPLPQTDETHSGSRT